MLWEVFLNATAIGIIPPLLLLAIRQKRQQLLAQELRAIDRQVDATQEQMKHIAVLTQQLEIERMPKAQSDRLPKVKTSDGRTMALVLNTYKDVFTKPKKVACGGPGFCTKTTCSC